MADDTTGTILKVGIIGVAGYLGYQYLQSSGLWAQFFGGNSFTTAAQLISYCQANPTGSATYGGQTAPCSQWMAAAGSSTSTTSTSTTGLTVADAATYPYSSAITAAQMTAINAALQTELQGGQIPTIAGNSVLAYMLGWGGASAGATQTVLGDSYSFDGTNWHLTSGGMGHLSAAALVMKSSRVPLRLIHGGPRYRLRGRLA